MKDLKKGDEVIVSLRGTVVRRPLKHQRLKEEDWPVQIRVEGKPGWWAVVPRDAVESVDDYLKQVDD